MSGMIVNFDPEHPNVLDNNVQLDRIEAKLDELLNAVNKFTALADSFASTPMAGVMAKLMKR